MSKAITEKHEDPGHRWGPGVEMAPSVVREDEPTIARTIGLIGAALVIFGGLALLLNVTGQTNRVGLGPASLLLALGTMGLLSHAAYDRDLQIRRLYWGLGVALLVVGVFVCVIPFDGTVGGLFGLGYPCIALALLFLLANLHHETDPFFRDLTIKGLGIVGAVGAATALLLGNNFWGEFMVPRGALLALMGLAYLAAFVSQVGIASDHGYRTGLALGAAGLVAVFLGIIRSFASTGFLVPTGLLYIGLGLLYVGVAFSLCSDSPFVVLTRRELSSYFFSPLVYLVLGGLTFVAWINYRDITLLATARVLPEPIIRYYLFGLWPVLTVTFLVPILTMRLLSEEKRTGSLEVLLTAPVNETTVVLGKFLAGFLLYLLMWTPWWLFLVALRIGGGAPFEYRSLFTFVLVMSVTGAGFMAMGLFFSSLTSNQIISAVLSFAMMMAFLGIYMWRGQKMGSDPNSPLVSVLLHMDYIELWLKATDGILSLKFLLYHASMAVIWLFLTVKVLEARRWA